VNRPHDAYTVRCRVPGYDELCRERVHVRQLKKCRQLGRLALSARTIVLTFVGVSGFRFRV
jgi:hypothetical protein